MQRWRHRAILSYKFETRPVIWENVPDPKPYLCSTEPAVNRSYSRSLSFSSSSASSFLSLYSTKDARPSPRKRVLSFHLSLLVSWESFSLSLFFPPLPFFSFFLLPPFSLSLSNKEKCIYNTISHTQYNTLRWLKIDIQKYAILYIGDAFFNIKSNY